MKISINTYNGESDLIFEQTDSSFYPEFLTVTYKGDQFRILSRDLHKMTKAFCLSDDKEQ